MRCEKYIYPPLKVGIFTSHQIKKKYISLKFIWKNNTNHR